MVDFSRDAVMVFAASNGMFLDVKAVLILLLRSVTETLPLGALFSYKEIKAGLYQGLRLTV